MHPEFDEARISSHSMQRHLWNLKATVVFHLLLAVLSFGQSARAQEPNRKTGSTRRNDRPGCDFFFFFSSFLSTAE